MRNSAQIIPLKRANVDTFQLEDFIDAGFTVIPLEANGKRPIHKNWTKRPYGSRKVLEKHVGNFGLRLGDTDLVLDVDTRRNGVAGLKKLCRDIGLDLDGVPRTNTGGGFHYFLKKPGGIRIVDSLKDYPGVEFKSLGRQVVAAGSVHPNGRRYELEFTELTIGERPEAPANLLELIERPAPPERSQGGGELTPEQAAELLALLPAEKFASNDTWLELMMAVNHGTGGDAREEFLDWSESDPAYADRRNENGARWDSLTVNPSANQITVATLYMALKDAGHGDKIPRGDGSADFEGALEESGGNSISILEQGLSLNGRAEAKDTIANAYIAIHRSGTIPAFDEFHRTVIFKASKLPWDESYGRELDDNTLRMLRMFLVNRYQGNAYTPSKENVFEAVKTIAFGNKYDPVVEYLGDVQSKWDGKERVKNLFGSYFNCGDSDYVRAVSTAFMAGAARRPRKPGCKFDTMPILKSVQGWNKSTGIKALFGPEFFSDAHLGDLRGKDAAMIIRGIWGLELPELEGMNRADSNTLKAFMSRATDRIRDPFNVVVSNVHRRGVFIGTANEGGFLKDATGGRRFWPMTLQAPVNVDAIIADRDQLWAEAATLEAQGASDVLPEELWKVAAKHQRAETAIDPWLDELRGFLDQRAADHAFGERASEGISWPPGDRVHTRELLEALRIMPDRQTTGMAQRLRTIMESSALNWRHKESLRVRGRVGPGYVSPDFVERKRM